VIEEMSDESALDEYINPGADRCVLGVDPLL